MPHAIRRVYVARRARIAASLVVSLTGTMLIVTALSPGLAKFFARGLPGINPAVLCTLVIAAWLAGLFAYAFARALDEHRFAVAMSHYVMPSKDLDNDIERLSHENPDEMARQMAHRLEVKAAALPVLAASVLLPVTALFIVHAARVKGWPVIAEFEASIAAHAKYLALSGVAGVVSAIVMTRRFARLSTVAPVAGALAIATGVAAIVGWHWLVTGTLLATATAFVVRRLRIERAKLQAEDPAAGSEMFTWRGVVDRVRSLARYLKGRNAKIALGASVFLVAAFYNSGTPARQPAMTKSMTMTNVTMPNPAVPNSGGYRFVSLGDGRLQIVAELEAKTPLDIQSFSGLAMVPPGWMLNVGVEVRDLDRTGSAIVSMEDQHIEKEGAFSISACGMAAKPINMRIESAERGSVNVIIRPTLLPATCGERHIED